jgi:nucleoside-diphosphate-sugar epimerase
VQPSVVVAAAFPPGHATVDADRRAHGSQMLANLFALFEAIRARSGELRLVLVGSAAAYGHGGGPSDPGQALLPRTFRGALKAAESLLTRQLAEEAGIPLVELRVFTAYGPYEQRERLLRLMRAWLGERASRRTELSRLGASRGRGRRSWPGLCRGVSGVQRLFRPAAFLRSGRTSSASSAAR